MKLKLINPKILSDLNKVTFMFHTRRHPDVDSMLTGDPPSDFNSHLQYLTSVKNKKFYVAIDGDAPVGYSQITESEDCLELGFVVHPDFQGKGFGKDLVKETLKKSKELSLNNQSIYLVVKKSNLKAINIYTKFGFKKVSENVAGEIVMEYMNDS